MSLLSFTRENVTLSSPEGPVSRGTFMIKSLCQASGSLENFSEGIHVLEGFQVWGWEKTSNINQRNTTWIPFRKWWLAWNDENWDPAVCGEGRKVTVSLRWWERPVRWGYFRDSKEAAWAKLVLWPGSQQWVQAEAQGSGQIEDPASEKGVGQSKAGEAAGHGRGAQLGDSGFTQWVRTTAPSETGFKRCSDTLTVTREEREWGRDTWGVWH